jgi:hypothetical protein
MVTAGLNDVNHAPFPLLTLVLRGGAELRAVRFQVLGDSVRLVERIQVLGLLTGPRQPTAETVATIAHWDSFLDRIEESS